VKLFLAPHNDDEALYGAFTIQREKPLVIIVTDGARHEKRGLVKADVRRLESFRACSEHLGAPIDFLRIPDDQLSVESAIAAFKRLELKHKGIETVYAPSWYGHGNQDHNVVSVAAGEVWGKRVRFYSTYTAQCVKVEGLNEIIPTESELHVKRQALACYVSQIRINGQYFTAARNGSEYLD